MNKILLVLVILAAALVSNAAALSGSSVGEGWSITEGDSVGNSATAYAYTTSGHLSDYAYHDINPYYANNWGDISSINGEAGAGVSVTNQWGDTAYSDVELIGTGTLCHDQTATSGGNYATSAQAIGIQLAGKGSAKAVSGASTDRFGVKGQTEVSAAIDQPAPIGFGYLYPDQMAGAGGNIGSGDMRPQAETQTDGAAYDTGNIFGGSDATQSVNALAFTEEEGYTASVTAMAKSANKYGLTGTVAYVENGYMGNEPVDSDNEASKNVPGENPMYDVFQEAHTHTGLVGTSGSYYCPDWGQITWDPSAFTGSGAFGKYEDTYSEWVQKVENGVPVLDENNNPVMVENWITTPLLVGTGKLRVETFAKNDISGNDDPIHTHFDGSLGAITIAHQFTNIFGDHGEHIATIM